MKHVMSVTKALPAKAEEIGDPIMGLVTCLKESMPNPMEWVGQITQKGSGQ